MKSDINKEKLKTALIKKQTKIPIFCYNAPQLLREVTDENPDIVTGIEQVCFTELPAGGVFTVRYRPTTRSRAETFQADTAEQIEEIIHKSITRYDPDVVISVDKDTDAKKICDNFITLYHGYYSNLISVRCEQRTIVGCKRKIVRFSFNYRIGRVKLCMMETEVTNEVKRLGRTLFCAGMSDETKAFIAHNYLASTVTYRFDENVGPLEKSYMQSAYGALINHKCVCQGYAEAYKRILDSQGIPCEVICGKIRKSAEYHAWNAVSFDNKNYYHIDVTWDSQKTGSARYKYYGLSDAALSTERIWNRGSEIICNSKENILQAARLQIAREGDKFAAEGADKKYFG